MVFPRCKGRDTLRRRGVSYRRSRGPCRLPPPSQKLAPLFASQRWFCAICCSYLFSLPTLAVSPHSSPRPQRLTELKRDYPEVGVVRHLLCGRRRAMLSDSCSMIPLRAITTCTAWDACCIYNILPGTGVYNRCTVYDAILERSSSVGNKALGNLYFFIEFWFECFEWGDLQSEPAGSRHVPGSKPPFSLIPDPDQNKEDTSCISAVAYGVYIHHFTSNSILSFTKPKF